MSIIYEALKKVEKKEPSLSVINISKEESAQQRKAQSSHKINKITLFAVVGVGVFVLSLFAMHLFQSNLAARETSFYEAVYTRANSQNSTVNEESSEGYHLQGIIYTEDNPIALINGKRIGRGEKIGEAVLMSLSQKGVELETKDGKIQLSLE